MAYPDWQQQRSKLPGYPTAAAPAPAQQQRHMATGTMPQSMPANG
ncbi:MAG TPA: hypothetical protein VFN46_06375 [Acetobacteraceae bacterium]|nr:hypothetical protein [Acetobacteraceae bacterium]